MGVVGTSEAPDALDDLPIPLTKPEFDDEEERLVCEAIRSGWVTQGPMVADFERQVAEYVQARAAVAVTSATAGLFLSMKALGIGPGDEVIVPSLSFIATANGIVQAGATPVFVDVDPETLNIDSGLVEQAITPRTRAIVPVDQLGMPAEMEPLRTLADQHGLKLVQDGACALGARYNGQPVGKLANMVCYSFHPRKVIVTGEGGMITTEDEELADRMKRMRHQGMSVSDLERHRASKAIVETYPEIGYNFRMSDLQAAMGLAQMKKLPSLLTKRRRLAERYHSAFGERDDIEIPMESSRRRFNYQSYIVRLRGAKRSERDVILEEMHRRGVQARRGLMAIHLEPCYAGARLGGTGLPWTEAVANTSVNLPIYPSLREREQEYVISTFCSVVSEILPPKTSTSRSA